MRRSLEVAVLGTVMCLAAPAFAAAPGDGGKPGRYVLQAIEGGTLRMDTETGAMSLCTQTGGTVTCNPVEDDRAATRKLEQLEAENKQLKADVKRLEDALDQSQADRKPKMTLPTEEDVDKALNYVERMIKKFRDKLKSMEEGSPNAGSGADKGKAPAPNGKGTPL